MISAGTRLGPYEIVSPLGAGGMGEVYRARDTRLDRTVAVKVLPAELSTSVEVRQRFEREARAISQLSHPHICALYDVGNQDGVEFLVMEYLEGQTLAERLAKGPLPPDQTLRYGGEIADALDKAHRQGIVHRDLKPGNVMLTKSGVKLLDFGLAKAVAPVVSPSAVTSLPTAAATPSLTQEGTILGTIQYMAPEQLEGKEADARTDIFALGTVLYEMATGRRPFEGRSQAFLIAAILEKDPRPISDFQAVAPPALDRLVRTCLAKEPDDRWQTARDVGRELRWIGTSSGAASPTVSAVRGRAARFPWLVAGIALATAIAVFTVSRRNAPARPVVRAFIPPPSNTSFHFLEANCGPVAVSRDGRQLVFSAIDERGIVQLWVRALDAQSASPIPGTEGATFPFWSPDGRSLGFFSGGRLQTVEASATAAPPRALSNVLEARGGSWGPDGTILFCSSNAGPVYRIPFSGGKPVAVTSVGPGERNHPWPSFLPDGRHFLYEIRFEQLERSGIYAGSLASMQKHLLVAADSNAIYSAGYLLFRKAGRLVAAPFDPDSQTVKGEAVELARGVENFPPTGGTIFSASDDLLAFGTESESRRSRFVWLDRSGKEITSLGSPANYLSPRLSNDGRQLAVSIIESLSGPPNVWLYDSRRGTGTRLTHRPRAALVPVFSPDGSRVVFSCIQASGVWDLFEVEVARPGMERTIVESQWPKYPTDFSRDGRFLLYTEFHSPTRGDLQVLPLSGDRRPRSFIATPYDEGGGVFSPDGRWVAYTSDESGRKEVHVASFPDPSHRYRVSSDGASQPRWSGDGRELFYVSGKSMMSVPVEKQGDEITFGQARTLFERQLQNYGSAAFYLPNRYDVSADGRFLVLVRASDEPAPPIALVFHWTELLRK